MGPVQTTDYRRAVKYFLLFDFIKGFGSNRARRMVGA